ncbi:MAG: penicillin-binding protein 2 [Mycobacteriales bacterium]
MSDRSRLRLFVLRVVVLAILATLFGRLWYLQVYASEEYAAAASANRVREVVQPAPRGEVHDARGTPLVRNRTALVVTVSRSTVLRQHDGGQAVLARLGAVLGRPAEALAQQIRPCGGSVQPPCWRGSPYRPVPVAEFDAGDRASLTKVLQIEEHREDFPGVRAQFTPVRDYPQGRLAAHVLGYLGPISPDEVDQPEYDGVQPSSLVGRAGIEATYEASLRGQDGIQRLLVDHVGTVTGSDGETAPRPGDTLVLSLDAAVQKVAEDALARGIERARGMRARGSGDPLVADSGSVVVLEAQSGRLVAMASYPSYDPAVFVGGASPGEYAQLMDESRGAPLVFRAIQGAYAPASTFKVVSAAAAVASGDYPLAGRYPCPGVYRPTGQRNFGSASFGTIDLRKALVKSCDTVFYKFGYEQWLRDGGNRPVERPRDPMIRMAQAFGLGERTGIDLPSERRGTIADRAYKQAYWEATRENRCKGAQNTALPRERRRANQEFCDEGFRFRGGDATNFAIGQGDTLVTPLQLATVYAAIANGGKVLEPHVGWALRSPAGEVREIAPKLRSTVPVDPLALGYLRDALAGVTQPGGTAARAFAGAPVAVAGKTGTGEVANRQDTSWFASYAPVARPELVVVGIVSQGGTGGTVAAPMVREIYDGIYGSGGTGRAAPALPDVRPGGA